MSAKPSCMTATKILRPVFVLHRSVDGRGIPLEVSSLILAPSGITQSKASLPSWKLSALEGCIHIRVAPSKGLLHEIFCQYASLSNCLSICMPVWTWPEIRLDNNFQYTFSSFVGEKQNARVRNPCIFPTILTACQFFIGSLPNERRNQQF